MNKDYTYTFKENCIAVSGCVVFLIAISTVTVVLFVYILPLVVAGMMCSTAYFLITDWMKS